MTAPLPQERGYVSISSPLWTLAPRSARLSTDALLLPSPQIKIASSTKKNVPVYNLKITVSPKSGPSSTVDLAESFTQWFDSQGHFVAVPFQELLATAVPVVGRLDPRRIRSQTQDLLLSSPDVLDALLAASSSPPAIKTQGSDVKATGAEPTPKKGGKRRKA